MTTSINITNYRVSNAEDDLNKSFRVYDQNEVMDEDNEIRNLENEELSVI